MSLYNERRHPQGGRGGVEMTGVDGTKVESDSTSLAALDAAFRLRDAAERLALRAAGRRAVAVDDLRQVVKQTAELLDALEADLAPVIRRPVDHAERRRLAEIAAHRAGLPRICDLPEAAL